VTDLNTKEQDCVRAALRFLRARCGGSWEPVAKALGFQPQTLKHVIQGRAVSASLAVRTARFADVSIDALLQGQFPPPGTCPHCGHCAELAPTETA